MLRFTIAQPVLLAISFPLKYITLPAVRTVYQSLKFDLTVIKSRFVDYIHPEMK